MSDKEVGTGMEVEEAEDEDEGSGDMDSESSESDVEADNALNEIHVQELKKQLAENPYMYNSHVELIRLYREMGELAELREARERMSELFPLTEELWLDWLRDEIPLATEESERHKLEDLFERAVKDYLSVQVWLEYVQYCIGGMGLKDGVDKIRSVFERALTAAGRHVTCGTNLWEAYREFENAILAGLMPQPGQVVAKDKEEAFKAQHQIVEAIFKRQLSIPLYEMEETFAEYKEWLQGEVDSYTNQVYQKAKSILEKLRPFEEALEEAEPPKLQEYKNYIEFELKEDDPARIQCIFERAIQENCLDTDLWIMYAKYLDNKLNVKPVVLSFYDRSVRNCPWCGDLWQRYLLAMERHGEDHEKIKGLMDKALTAGITNPQDFVLLWSTYLDYLRRRIVWDGNMDNSNTEPKADVQLLRDTFEGALSFISGLGPEADPTESIRQYWARIEAIYCKNMEKARLLWNEILSAGHGNEANMWLEFFRLERSYGDAKHCRRVLQRALNSVTDWPESIVEAFINYEKDEGTLEQYDTAMNKCQSQMERIKERKIKAEEKEAEIKTFKKKQGKDKFQKNKQGNFRRKSGGKGDKSRNRENNVASKKISQQPNKSQSTESPFKVPSVPSQSRDLKRKVDTPEDQASTDGPAMPPPGHPGEKKSAGPPPGYKGDKPEKQPPPGYKGPKSAPPPGYVPPVSEQEDEPPSKKHKTDDLEPQLGAGDAEHHHKYNRTVFVSNLDYSIEEERIGQIFKKCGDLTEIRLIRNFKGGSKGYAYVEFKDELCAMEAIKLDRTPVEGRPMYVSQCEDRSKGKAHSQFKFSNNMEKNKLFVKNLPFTCTKEALEQIFSEYGKLKEVRLVTYRSGAPKGLAYVEFEDEQQATQALLKTDGLQIGDHNIEVAISNPPQRKAPAGKKEEHFTPSLGSGKKETETRGKARTQLSLMPRSVSRSSASSVSSTQPNNVKKEQPSNGDAASNKSTGMSNADFRNMLLKR